MGTTFEPPSVQPEPIVAFEDVDAFLAHLEDAVAADPREAAAVLRSLVEQARIVRAQTFRRTTEMLDEGGREADRIVAESTATAEQILRWGLTELDRRVRVAAEVTAVARETLRFELRADQIAAEATEAPSGAAEEGRS